MLMKCKTNEKKSEIKEKIYMNWNISMGKNKWFRWNYENLNDLGKNYESWKLLRKVQIF